MKKGLIIASFGTSHLDAYEKSVKAFVNKVEERYPDLIVVEAITSRIVKKILTEDGKLVFDEKEAYEYLKKQGAEKIYILSLHVLEGHEYEKLIPLGLVTSKALMHDETSVIELAQALQETNTTRDIYVGHGTDHKNDKLYELLEDKLKEKGDFLVGTIEGERSFEVIKEELEKLDKKKIRLIPLLLVAGDHAKNDIAGELESWKSRLSELGYDTEVLLRGLGEVEKVSDIYMDRLKKLIQGEITLIGTGPGSPMDLTQRAIAAIREADVIFVPVNKGRTLAYDTIRYYTQGKKVIELDLPMVKVKDSDYDRCQEIIRKEAQGLKSVYITIGDAMIYSTTNYIMKRLQDFKIVVVSGLPSFVKAFGAVGLPITEKNETFSLLDRLDENNRGILKYTDSVAILKARMNTERTLNILEEENFDYCLVRRVSYPEEEIIKDREEILKNTDYIAQIIARKRK